MCTTANKVIIITVLLSSHNFIFVMESKISGNKPLFEREWCSMKFISKIKEKNRELCASSILTFVEMSESTFDDKWQEFLSNIREKLKECQELNLIFDENRCKFFQEGKVARNYFFADAYQYITNKNEIIKVKKTDFYLSSIHLSDTKKTQHNPICSRKLQLTPL